MDDKMSNFPFRSVIFDLDGTLVDSAPDLTAALNYSLAVLGRPPASEASVRDMVGHGARALLQKGLAATGELTAELVEQGFPIFIDHYRANLSRLTRPFPGVEAALEQLAALGVTLGICTNKQEALASALIEQLGWAGRFACVIGGDTLPVRKPDPAPLLAAITQAGGGPAAFIGDSITDTDTGRNAAIPTVAVSFGFSDRPVAELGANAVIDHYDQLLAALRSLAPLHP
jgi:phosphoglycolate phosphatase